MSAHTMKDLTKFLNKLEKIGFTIQYTKKTIKIFPPKKLNVEMYITHYTDKGYHPVRRYVQNICKLNVE